MFARRVLLVFIVLLALPLSGCGSVRGVFGRRVQDTPAPTAIPLPTREVVPSATSVAVLVSPTPTEMPAALATATTSAAALPEPTHTASPQTNTATPAPTPTASSPVTGSPTRVVPPAEEIRLPPGFGISVFIKGLSGPRMMALGPDNELYVAERGAGRIVRLPDRNLDGVADGVEVVADQLRAPSSIAFFAAPSSPFDGTLYVGETTRVLRLSQPDGSGVFRELTTVVDGLPSGGHNTRTVLFSPDGTFLYVSVGSSCNVCVEEDPRRAAIVRYRPDGSEETLFATGLRWSGSRSYSSKLPPGSSTWPNPKAPGPSVSMRMIS